MTTEDMSTTGLVSQPKDAPSPPLGTARHGTGRHKPFMPPPPPTVPPPGPYRKSALKIDQNEVLYTYTGPLGPNVIFLLFTHCLRPKVVRKVVAACMLLFPGAL